MFLLSLMSLSLASDPDFTNLEAGEVAPFSGKLFLPPEEVFRSVHLTMPSPLHSDLLMLLKTLLPKLL